MVVIFFPAAALTGKEQERTGAPSTCTVHAPHCATPQPYFVPVRPTCSRIAHSSGGLSSTSTLYVLPLMDTRAIGFSLSGIVQTTIRGSAANLNFRIRWDEVEQLDDVTVVHAHTA